MSAATATAQATTADPNSPFAELAALAGHAAAVDVESMGDSEVLASLTDLCAAASAVQVALARAIAQADRTEATITDCGLKVGGWIARHANRPARPCRRQATTARHACQHFPEAVEAAACGSLGWDHVELLVSVSNARNRGKLTAVQGELIEAAQNLRWREWETLVRSIAAVADEDGAYDPNEDAHANRLRVDRLPDGTHDISGRLVGEWAFLTASTLDAIADELFHQYARDHDLNADIEIPDRSTLLGLALAEACRRARAIDINNTTPARPEAVVIIDTDTNGQTTAFDRYGRTVPPAALQALLGDADYRALITDPTGNPLNLGRRHRLVTRDQKIALTARDGGCTFPGCEAPAHWCDAHHVITWLMGGPTDTDNLALLCRHHHGITHTKGWNMQPSTSPGSLFEWQTPTGNTLHSQHRQGAPPQPA